jgi:hypothetical protein
MVSAARLREIAASFEGAVAVPHVDRLAFRTTRRIFVTVAPDEQSANLMITPEDQEILVRAHPAVFRPVPGGWGKSGATTVELPHIDEALLTEALRLAHERARPAPKKVRRKKAAARARGPKRRGVRSP